MRDPQAYEQALERFRVELRRLRPEGVRTPLEQIADLGKRVANVEDRLSRLHRGLVLLADLQREAGLTQHAIAHRVEAAGGGRWHAAHRSIIRCWCQGTPPSAQTLAKWQAVLEGDPVHERAQRLGVYAARAASGAELFEEEAIRV